MRGVAILLVVGAHAGIPLVRHGGSVGLTLFFVLSGYLITSILLRELDATGTVSLRAFYARRLLRLMPALVVTVVIGQVVAVTVGVQPLGEAWRAGALVLGYLANFDAQFDIPLGGLSFLWSLALEEQFYVVWPLALLAAVRIARARPAAPGSADGSVGLPLRRLPAILVVLAAASLAARFAGPITTHEGFRDAYYLPHTNAYGLLIGSATALWVRSGRTIPGGRRLATSMLASLVVLSTVVGLRTGLRERDDAASLVANLAVGPLAVVPAALLIFAVATQVDVVPVLRQRLLRAFGAISYGLYLWHGPAIAVAQEVAGGNRAGDLRSTAIRCAACTVAVLLAVASHRFIEQPFMRRKARFERVPSAEARDAATAG